VCRQTACIDQAIDKGALRRALEIPLSTELRAELLASATALMIEGGAHGQE
jgi:predicted RNA-binding protein YlxR (DUF448 family)